MNEKRFKSTLDEDTMSIMPYLVSDKEEECFYNLQGCVDLLNKLYRENKKLKCINDQLEERLESSGIGVALKMDCDMNDRF